MRQTLKRLMLIGGMSLACLASYGQSVPDPTGPDTLFIEAEDFNYSDDGATGGLFTDFGAGDCLLLGKGAVLDVDYHEVNNGNDQNVYRGPTGVEAGKQGTDGLLRGGKTISCSYIVGWNDAGDWYNYTRTFPGDAGAVTSYKVYARLSSGGAAESAELSLVTSDPSQLEQGKFILGAFNAPATGNWDVFHTVPLRNPDGSDVTVKLKGQTTLRFTTLPGAFDFNYLAFVPQAGAATLTPRVQVSPANNSKVTRHDNVAIHAQILDQDSTVKGDTIKLFLDDMTTPIPGVSVTEDHTTYAPGAVVDVTISDLPPGQHAARLSFTDSAGKTITTDWSFELGPEPLPAETLFVEAEDYNYSTDGTTGGQYANFGDPSCSLRGLNAIEGVDYHEVVPSNDQAGYRDATGPETGKLGTDGTERGVNTVDCSYILGWNDAGDWVNYTRDFPTATYKVYGRFASGGADEHSQLDKVTSDPTQPNQTTSPLGLFDSEATHNWDGFHFVPLKDATGKDALVKLSGITTLRWTMRPGNSDFNYMAFVPQPGVLVRPAITSVSPTDKSIALRDPLVSITIADRDTTVKGSSIKITLDGNPLTPLNVTETHTGDDSSGATASIQLPRLTIGSTHALHFTFQDNATPANSQTLDTSFTVGEIATDSLFVEAEDYNYSDDGTTGGLHPNFGDSSCSLAGKGAVEGVDYHEVTAHNEQAGYRDATGPETGKLGTDGYVRGLNTITCSYILGWNQAGDWFNYTRDFGPSRRYNIIARFASGGASENGTFSRVTSDPTLPDQTTEKLGSFNSPATGNWDVFHNVPLKNDLGEFASIRLSGVETLRVTVDPGDFDFNYLAFVPADEQFVGPKVISMTPADGVDYPRAAKVAAAIKNQDSNVKVDTVQLTFDGVLTPAVAVATADGATIEFQAPAGSNVGTVHTVKVTYKDDQATAASYSKQWSYKEGIYNSELNLFIEAEDFNTAGGEYFPSNPASGEAFNAKGLYLDKDAVTDVDFHDNGTDDPNSQNYRQGEAPNIGMGNSSGDNFIRGAGDRPGFTSTIDWKIGWNDAGEWRNYTRTFPSGSYNIYSRMASGGADMHAHLDLVDDRTTGTPNLTRLGQFDAQTTGGWDTFIFVAMKDGEGNLARVDLGGEQTLRYTIDPGNHDHNYIMLVPAGTAAPRFTGITLSPDGKNVTLTWTGDATLEVADDINGPWATVPGATSGLVAPVDRVKRFARLRAK